MPEPTPLPCPFCGEPPTLCPATNDPNWWFLECRRETCGIRPSIQGGESGACLSAWNKRAVRPQQLAGVSRRVEIDSETGWLNVYEREHGEGGWMLVSSLSPSSWYGQLYQQVAERDARIAELERGLAAARDKRDLEKSRAANAEKALDKLAGWEVERRYSIERIAELEAALASLKKLYGLDEVEGEPDAEP